MANELTLEKYEQMLKNHDWYYMMSDSGYVYEKGYIAERQLKAVAKQSVEHQALYDKYYKQKFPATGGNNG